MHANHRRVERVETFSLDVVNHLSSDSADLPAFLEDNGTVGLLDGCANRIDVHGTHGAQIDHIDAPDSKTVKFILKAPFGPFLSTLASSGGSIVDPEVMEKEQNGDLAQGYLADHSMGSGAYQVTGWEKSQQITMEPNPHWGGPKPFFKQIVIKIIKEASARRLQLEKGDLDIAEDIPVDQLAALQKTEGITVVFVAMTADRM